MEVSEWTESVLQQSREKGMEIIFRDILKQWTGCWQGAVIVGILFMVIGRQTTDQIFNQHKVSGILFFADGVYLYYLLFVTLFSRIIGSRREVGFMPFMGEEILRGDYHYLIENILFFIPFGFLLCATLYAYGKKCNMKIIIPASLLTSVSVELLQYLFSCGKSETEDVIANVSGAVLGYLVMSRRK